MKVGVINSSAFGAVAFRIDPSLHLSEGVKVRAKLDKSPYALTSVADCSSKIFLGNIFSRIFVKKKEFGVTYLAASDTVLANIETGKYLSKKQASQLDYLKLDKDWILVTCSGTLGNVTYTNGTFCDKIATHDLIRIIPDDSKFKKGCLYAFLAGKYGYYQITQSQFGGVVKHINDKQAGAISVPQFPEDFQTTIDNLIQDSAKLREEATDALKEAVLQISNFIDVCKIENGYKSKVVNIQEVISSLKLRIDPPALMNDGVEIMNILTSRKNYKLIKDLGFVVRRPGIFKRIYVENGIPYIKGSEIFLNNPFMRCEKLSRTRTPFIDEMELKEGQILVTCAGSVGSIKMITKEYEDKKAIGSQDIIRIDAMYDDNYSGLYNKEYLFAYLQQPFVYSYIQSMKYGSVIERIEPFHVESIPVIEPTKEVSDKVKSLVQEYMDKTYKAFNAEETAISMVEQEIEKWNN